MRHRLPGQYHEPPTARPTVALVPGRGRSAADRRAKTRYLITGGAGFIGSHVADALVARGDRVVVLDDFSTGRPANVEHLAAGGSAELIEGSVTDERLVDRLVASCDCCFHLASAVGVKLVVAQPLETLRRIVRGTDVVVSTRGPPPQTRSVRLHLRGLRQELGRVPARGLRPGPRFDRQEPVVLRDRQVLR